jgi:hypothetical protein
VPELERLLRQESARFLDRLDRINKTLEKLAEEPDEIQMEVAPPVCPHCGQFNPTVRVLGDSTGPLMECVLEAECGNCNKTMFAVPIQWDMIPDIETYRLYLAEREKLQDAGRTTRDTGNS